MSAPRTDIEKQKIWHRGPLIGMALVVLFGVGLIVIWLMDEAADGQSPGDNVPAPEVSAPSVTEPAQPAPTTTEPVQPAPATAPGTPAPATGG